MLDVALDHLAPIIVTAETAVADRDGLHAQVQGLKARVERQEKQRYVSDRVKIDLQKELLQARAHGTESVRAKGRVYTHSASTRTENECSERSSCGESGKLVGECVEMRRRSLVSRKSGLAATLSPGLKVCHSFVPKS